MNLRAPTLAALLGVLLASPAFGADATAEDLPTRAQALRDAGVDADQVRQALVAARSAKLSAEDAAGLLHASIAPVEEHGPVEGFGAFVKDKLDAGLRGPELASSIQAEHAKRGIGAGKSKAGTTKPRPNRPTSW